MIRNYLKITLRHLWKQRGYALINVFGLAVGLAFCALLLLYVQDEWSYDRFHTKADRIYRVLKIGYHPDGSVNERTPEQPMPLGPALAADFPEVERYARFFDQTFFVHREDAGFEEEVLFGEPSMFDLFDFPLLRGRPGTALAEPNNVVLSASAARIYFGEEDPMGQSLTVLLPGGPEVFTVAGIAQDPPGNSSIQFDVLLPFSKLPDVYFFFQDPESWGVTAFPTYVQLTEQASVAGLEAKLPDFRARYYPDEAAEMREEERWNGTNAPYGYALQPLPAMHLDPSVAGGLTPASSPTYVHVLMAIALAILFIACINFTTLAIGRSANRSLEVGIRKTMGAQRLQLMGQFWGEAILLSLLALLVGIALAELFLPTFNELAGKELHIDYASDWQSGALLVGLMLLTGLLAGSYPALVLSGFQPITTLKRRLAVKGSNRFTRTLVVVQFTLSVFLIVGTLVMMRQLDYIRNKNLGLDREHVVIIDTRGATQTWASAGSTQNMDGARLVQRFRNALAGRRDIVGLTGSNSMFTRGRMSTEFVFEDKPRTVHLFRTESNFVDILGMEVVAGRDFAAALSTDSTDAVLVNEALVRAFGLTEPVGQRLNGLEWGQVQNPEIVGVVRDFNFASLHTPVEPALLSLNPTLDVRYLFVRVRPNSLPDALAALRSTWRDLAPDIPFRYNFLDETLATQYQAEERWSRIVGYATGFAVLIACLGLFGLATLTVVQRTKEIGIRKVLGASVAGVAVLLSKKFARLVLLAVVLAVPAAYVVMSRWLDTFAYRIDLSWPIFLLAGSLALAVALLTVSYQAIRAALADPVESLRYE